MSTETEENAQVANTDVNTPIETEPVEKPGSESDLAVAVKPLNERIAMLSIQRDEAVRAYREIVQKVNPLVPPEMINGASIAEINASLEKAINLVDRIKKGVEAEIETKKASAQVPAGSPGRTEPDTASMSSREKIKYGIEKSRRPQ